MSALPSSPLPSPAPRRRRRLWLFLPLTLLVLGALVWLGYQQVHNHLQRQQALTLARTGAFQQAAPLLQQVLARNPRDLEVVQALARGYLHAEERDRAEEALTVWCNLAPDAVEPRRLRLQAYSQDQRWEEALADARWLWQRDPGNPAAQRRVAGLLFSLGRFQEAEQECRALLERNPDDRPTLLLLAETRRAQGDGTEAATLADRVLQEDPQSSAALMLRGVLYREAGQPEQAVELFRRVVALDPTRQRTANYELSLALARAGRTEEARQAMAEVRRLQDAEVLRVASETQPDNLPLKVQAAEALLNSGDTAKALEFLNQALRRDPSYRPAHAALADYFEQHGDLAAAAQHRRAAETP